MDNNMGGAHEYVKNREYAGWVRRSIDRQFVGRDISVWLSTIGSTSLQPP